MFCGKYSVVVNQDSGKIKLKHGFEGRKVSVLCLKSKEGSLFVAASADETEIKEYIDTYEVVDCMHHENISDEILLPEIFFEDIQNDKFLAVMIIAVGNSIEIIKKDSLKHLFE